MAEDVYRRLAEHVAALGMGLPVAEGLEEILKANFTPVEAEVALALPTRVAPMQPVSVDEISPQKGKGFPPGKPFLPLSSRQSAWTGALSS